MPGCTNLARNGNDLVVAGVDDFLRLHRKVVEVLGPSPVETHDPLASHNVSKPCQPPHLNGVKLHSNKFGRKGTTLQWGTNEKSKLDAEYYEVRNGHRGKFAGWDDWKGHVGFNDAEFGGKSKHFDAKPGRYMAIIRASDTSNNTGKKRTRRFKVG